jgi:deoxyribonuclease (pyrimidine dimer)
MTRINCVPVEELTDKHLLAEYRELPRISALSHKWRQKAMDTLPETYRLGEGHVKFFYNKGEYLRRRFEEQIVPEMQKRGFKTNFTKYRLHPEGLNNDWRPREQDISINKQRILDRLKK